MKPTHFICMDEAGDAFPVQVSRGELVDILAEAAAAVRPLRAAEIELPDGATPQEADWSTGSLCTRSVQGPVNLDDFDDFLMATAQIPNAHRSHRHDAPRIHSLQGSVSLDDFDDFLMATAATDDAHHYEAPRT